MGFSFLTPLFLAGMAALAIPVLIHLVQRQNPQGQAFPSLMFLRQIPYRERRRREIRHWLLLLLRCLGILLLVLAFARPFIAGLGNTAAITDERTDRVVLLDRSYSMAYAERWRIAQQAALDEIAGLTPNDRSAVIFFDHRAEAAGDLSSDHAAARSILENYQPGPGSTHYRVGLDQASRLLAHSDAGQREIVLISDFQRHGYDPEDKDTLQLPPGVVLRYAEPPADTAANATIRSLTLTPKQKNNQQIVELSAQIVNTGAGTLDSLSAALELDGLEVAKQTLELAERDTHTLTFELAPAIGSAVRGILRLSDDGLEADNYYYFVLLPAPKLPVLVLENVGARENQSLFLQRALELSGEPGYLVEVKTLDQLQSPDIDGKAIVVLNDIPIPGAELGDRLRSFVEDGGGLFVVAADRLQGGWPGGETGFLPGSLGRRVERLEARGGSINQLDTSHSLLELFNVPGNGSLNGAQIFQYRRLNPGPGDQVLARYDDGAVALMERRVGAGRVMVLTTTLDNYWNTLALQPVFAPLMHRLMNYLVSYQATPAWFTVGDVVDIARHTHTLLGGSPIAPDEDLILEIPGGEQRRLSGANKLLRLSGQGFYDVHRTTDAAAKSVIATNVDSSEADFSTLDPIAFVDAIATAGTQSETAADTVEMSGAAEGNLPEQEQQQRLWWYLLLSALVILGAETLLSNRLSGKAQQA